MKKKASHLFLQILCVVPKSLKKKKKGEEETVSYTAKEKEPGRAAKTFFTLEVINLFFIIQLIILKTIKCFLKIDL